MSQINVKQPEFVRQIFNEIAHREQFINYTIDYIPVFEVISTCSSIMKALIRGQKVSHSTEVKNDELSLIYKMLPNYNDQIEMFNIIDLFEREIYFYTKVFPKMMEFQRQRLPQKNDGFFRIPKVYASVFDRENNQYLLVLEDLRKCRKFESQHEFSLNHMHIYLKELAKFHAISFAMRDQSPNILLEFKRNLKDLFVKQWITNPGLNDYTKTVMDESLNSLLSSDIEAKEKFKPIAERFTEHLKECVDLDVAEPFAVITHGDSFSSNLLFQCNELNYPENVYFVDWQQTRYGSVALDLIHFVLVSTDKDFRDRHYDHIIKFYYKELSVAINNLGSDGNRLISFEDFLLQICRYGKFGLMLSGSFALWFSLIAMNRHPGKEKTIDIINAYQAKEVFFSESNKLFNEIMRNNIVDSVKYGYL